MRKSNISEDMIRKVLLKLIRERALHVLCIQQQMIRVSNLFPIDVFASGNDLMADEYRSLIAPIILEKNKILKNDEERALKYFNVFKRSPKSNLKKLVSVLKPLIAIVIITAIVSDEDNYDKQTSNEEIYFTQVTYEIFRPYLNVLKKHYINGYKRVSRFLYNAVHGKVNLSTLLENINFSNPEIHVSHILFHDDYIQDQRLLQPISAFDTAIYYAAITLFHHDYQYITPQSLFNLLSGERLREYKSVTTEDEVKNTHTKIGARLRSKIQDSITRLQNIDVAFPVTSISYENALKYQKKIDDIHQWNIRKIIHWCALSFMGKEYGKISYNPIYFHLSYKTYLTIANSGRHITQKLLPCGAIQKKKISDRIFPLSFSFLDTPPLYEEAKDEHCLLSFDIDLLNTPLTNNEENIALKCYLLRRIFTAMSMNLQELLITFDEIYRYLGKKQPNDEMIKKEINALRVQLHELRNKTKELLAFWSQKGVYSSLQSNTKTITIVF